MKKSEGEDGWTAVVEFKCRLERATGSGGFFQGQEVISRKRQCPLKGRKEELGVRNPAYNVVGDAAAKKFPDPCPVCKLRAKPEDFRTLQVE
jgi:hypothetical protein